MKSTFAILLSIFCALITVSSQCAEAPKEFKVSGITFQRPQKWEWVEVTSQMRQAQLKLSDAAKKESGEVVFFYFGPGSGGGTKANVDRWISQFKETKEQLKPKTDEVLIGKHKVTYVQVEGTYNSGMPGGPKTPLSNHALIGAIIEAEQGSVFVRLTAPVALGKSSLSDFKAMVESGLK